MKLKSELSLLETKIDGRIKDLEKQISKTKRNSSMRMILEQSLALRKELLADVRLEIRNSMEKTLDTLLEF